MSISPLEPIPFFRLAQARREHSAETWVAAGVVALQAAACALLVLYGYRRVHAPGASWAVVSSVLVLQPGLEQSLATSAGRILANVIGAITGAFLAYAFGPGPAVVALGLVLVVLMCELLKLDLALRTACASVVIVMFYADGHSPITSSVQRLAAVAVGCTAALLVQIMTRPVITRLQKRAAALVGRRPQSRVVEEA